MITRFINEYNEQNYDLAHQYIYIQFDMNKVSDISPYFPYVIIVNFENMIGEKLKDFERLSFIKEGKFETNICVGENRALNNLQIFVDEYANFIEEVSSTISGETLADEFDVSFPDFFDNKKLEITRRELQDVEHFYTNSDNKLVKTVDDVPSILHTSYDVISLLDFSTIVVEGLEDCLVPFLFAWKELEVDESEEPYADIRIIIHAENKDKFYGEVIYKDWQDGKKVVTEFEVEKDNAVIEIENIIKERKSNRP